MELTENHRRNIQVTFWLLDELLCSLERWAHKKEARSVFYKEVNNLTDAQCQQILERIAALREKLVIMRDELQLTEHVQDVSVAIKGNCNLFVNDNLYALKKKNLETFGDVPAELANYLDPKVEELIKLVEEITKIVE